MLEVVLAAKILPVRIFYPALHHGVIGQAIQVLEVLQPHHQARGFSGTAIVGAVQLAKGCIKFVPVDQRRQPKQFMALIKYMLEAMAKQVCVRKLIGLFWAHFFDPEIASNC